MRGMAPNPAFSGISGIDTPAPFSRRSVDSGMPLAYQQTHSIKTRDRYYLSIILSSFIVTPS